MSGAELASGSAGAAAFRRRGEGVTHWPQLTPCHACVPRLRPCSKLGSQRFGGLVFKAFRDADLETKSVAMYKEVGVGDRMGTLSREQFAELLQKIDSGLRALPATAQVARQQGEYLAAALRQADGNVAGARPSRS